MYIPHSLSETLSNFLSNSTTSNPSSRSFSQPDRLYLVPKWDYTLVLTSWLVSALGGYTATQLMTQVVTTKSLRARISWVTLASLAFGGCSIWCLHFIAMLAMDLSLPIHYAPIPTAISAIVAITATWLTFGYEFIQLFLYRKRIVQRRREVRAEGKRKRGEERALLAKKQEEEDAEAEQTGSTRSNSVGSLEVNGNVKEVVPLKINVTLDPTADLHDDEDEDDENENEQDGGPDHAVRANGAGLAMSDIPRLNPGLNAPAFKTPTGWQPESDGLRSPRATEPSTSKLGQTVPQRRSWIGFNTSDEDVSKRNDNVRFPAPGSSVGSRNGSIGPLDTSRNTMASQSRNGDPQYTRTESLTTFSNASTDSLPSLGSSHLGHRMNSQGSITSGASTGNSLAQDPTISDAAVQAYAGGAMSLRLRQLKDTNGGAFGWREVLDDFKSGWNRKVLIKGSLMGSSAFCMHYQGMASMRMGYGIEGLEGGVEWSWVWVAISWVIACIASIAAIVFMPLSKMDFRRQIAFAIVSSTAIEAMHWSGMWAATFYIIALPEYKGPFIPNTFPLVIDLEALPPSSTPHGLAISVILVGFITCMLSYVLLARSVTQSRDELVSAIHTKRTLWRVMAEKEAAIRADKQKTEFIAVASHEIRTPLHVISGYAELLDKTSLSSEQMECVKFILAGCESIRLITTDVLDFSKLQQADAESKARSEPINIRDLAKGIARGCSTPHFRRASADKLNDVDKLFPDGEPRRNRTGPNVEVILDIESNVPDIVWSDKVYLTRVIMNLINNALKFTSQGYVLVKLQILPPDTVLGHPKLAISVRDTGIGIHRDLRAAVFAPFRQADTSHTRSHAGTGLGLAICHQLAIRMKGRLGIWSSQGPEDRGTEISLLLPFEGGVNGEAAVLGPSDSRIINEAPTMLDRPLTEVLDDDNRISNGPRIGLALRQPELEGIFARAFRQRGCRVTIIEEGATVDTLPEVDRLWIDLNRIEAIVHSERLRDIGKETTLFFLCDNVHASMQSEEFQQAIAHLDLDIVCMPRPTVIQDVIRCMTDPEMADQIGGVRSRAWERASRKAKEAEIRKELEDSAPGMQSPPLISNAATQSLVAALIPNKPTTKKTMNGTGPPKPGSVILLVDDNIVNQKLGARLISKMKYAVETAGNGQIAVDMITKKRERYGLVLMDCQMPVMDGFEATRRIRHAERTGTLEGRLAVLALTANVSEDCRTSCHQAGADHFLEKPLDMTQLQAYATKYMPV